MMILCLLLLLSRGLALAGPRCSSSAPPTTNTKILRRLSEDFCGGALSTSVEPLGRHIVAAVGAFQTEKRRHFRTLQPLLVCFFQLVFVQRNGFHKESVLLEAVAYSTLKRLQTTLSWSSNSTAAGDIRLTSISIKIPFPKSVRARTAPWVVPRCDEKVRRTYSFQCSSSSAGYAFVQ